MTIRGYVTKSCRAILLKKVERERKTKHLALLSHFALLRASDLDGFNSDHLLYRDMSGEMVDYEFSRMTPGNGNLLGSERTKIIEKKIEDSGKLNFDCNQSYLANSRPKYKNYTVIARLNSLTVQRLGDLLTTKVDGSVLKCHFNYRPLCHYLWRTLRLMYSTPTSFSSSQFQIC